MTLIRLANRPIRVYNTSYSAGTIIQKQFLLLGWLCYKHSKGEERMDRRLGTLRLGIVREVEQTKTNSLYGVPILFFFVGIRILLF